MPQRKKTLEQARFIFTTGKMIRDRIFRIHAKQFDAGDKEAGYDELSLSQLYAVMITHEQREVTISRLADILGVSPPSVSVMVERLVEKGILTREPSRQDRRKVLVRVSPKGIRKIRKDEEAVLNSFVELIEKIGPETTRKWCEVLERVKEVQEGEV